MGIFKKQKSGGMADVIRCDEKDYLIWEWHPNKYEEGKLKREFSIRTNSVLRVREGEVAVFFYDSKADYIVGPHDEKLKTKNFPALTSIIGLWYEGDTPFQAEVFFINLGKAIQTKFVIPYFDVADPRFPDYQVPVAIRGSITFKISDYQNFVSFHKLANFEMETLNKKISDAVSRIVKEAAIKTTQENMIPVINLESKTDFVSDKAESKIKEKLQKTFAIECIGLDISSIEVDEYCQAYVELKRITKDITKRQVEANALHYEESLRIQREEEQYAQHMRTRQSNLGAYQTEIQGQVGVAGAEALGKMGENGVSNIDMGNGAGFNPMTMMAGIAVGSVVGNNIAGTMGNILNSSANNNVPPTIPVASYYIAVENNPVGPMSLEQLKEMISQNRMSKETLVWKQGTLTWIKAIEENDIKGFFPPDIPEN